MHNDMSLGFQIMDLARLFRRRFEQALAKSGLEVTAGEARTLFHAAKAGPIRQAALAERMLVEPMSLSNALDRLEARDLVTRRTDPLDRRANLIEVTPGAAPLVTRLQEIATATLDRATGELPPDEVETVRRCLSLMRGNLSDCAPGGTAA